MHAQAHMDKYGTTLEDLAAVRVKAATYGQINDRGVYRKAVTPEMFTDPENMMSGPVSSPLRVGDCCANATAHLALSWPAKKKPSNSVRNPSGSWALVRPVPVSI